MGDLVFVDANVLIYARDARDPGKRAQAAAWLLRPGRDDGACLDLQIINELTRWVLKSERNRSLRDIQDEIETLRAWDDSPITAEEVDIAWMVRERLGYQWFDCLLVASASHAGCRCFLTEDMAHGATFESLTLINPFRASLDDVLKRT